MSVTLKMLTYLKDVDLITADGVLKEDQTMLSQIRLSLRLKKKLLLQLKRKPLLQLKKLLLQLKKPLLQLKKLLLQQRKPLLQQRKLPSPQRKVLHQLLQQHLLKKLHSQSAVNIPCHFKPKIAQH